MKNKQTMDLKQYHYCWTTTLWKWPWRASNTLYIVEEEGEQGRKKAPKGRQHWALTQLKHLLYWCPKISSISVIKPNLGIASSMEVFFGLNKKKLKMWRLKTNQGEVSMSLGGFLSLPAELQLLCNCRATALRWQRQTRTCDNTRGQDWEMTRCVTDASGTCRPWRGQWLCPRKDLRRVEGRCESHWARQDKQRQLSRHIHPLPTPPHIKHPAQLFPLSPTSFPTAAAIPDSKPCSRAPSRSQCICSN